MVQREITDKQFALAPEKPCTFHWGSLRMCIQTQPAWVVFITGTFFRGPALAPLTNTTKMKGPDRLCLDWNWQQDLLGRDHQNGGCLTFKTNRMGTWIESDPLRMCSQTQPAWVVFITGTFFRGPALAPLTNTPKMKGPDRLCLDWNWQQDLLGRDHQNGGCLTFKTNRMGTWIESDPPLKV